MSRAEVRTSTGALTGFMHSHTSMIVTFACRFFPFLLFAEKEEGSRFRCTAVVRSELRPRFILKTKQKTPPKKKILCGTMSEDRLGIKCEDQAAPRFTPTAMSGIVNVSLCR